MNTKVMILLGSSSDFNIAQKAINVLEKIGVNYDIKVASAHRTHDKVKQIVLEGTKSGVDVFMGIAGLSAHLPGIIAANTYKPVIGVPVDVKMGGLDALFANAQMPFGAPVATVGVDRGENGAILACQIIGIYDEKVRANVSKMREEFFDKVHEDEEELLKKVKGRLYSPQKFNFEGENSGISTNEVVNNKNIVPEIAVIPGSYSDMKIAQQTTNFLDKVGIAYDMNIISPIRYPERFEKYLDRVEDVKLFIAISGLSAHVTGAIVAHSNKPVIGVPCPVQLGGFDALLSMINMPPGVPVATVGVGNGGNAALLAAEMLALENKKIKDKIFHLKKHIT
ncbi:MAG: 5-(carboxyamino)imidazole ribonucleotide mutase [Methanobacteriaceae archaeon]|nr:5-(carboxyamino)imidazole ribonucleotide mutase [Methanobacteriaceae archaeon]